MYQMKYRVNLSCPLAYRCLMYPNDMHKAVQHLFDSDRMSVNALYHKQVAQNEIYVYVRADEKPSVPSDVLTLVSGPTMFGEAVENGMCLPFYLRCNPVKQSCGHRYFLSDVAERMAWLRRKGDANGFAVESCTEVGRRTDVTVTKDKKSFTFGSVDMTGRLIVTDADAFRKCLSVGIGHEKVYGMGMILCYGC